MPQSIQVRIQNRGYSLRVHEGDERLTREIAQYVDAKIEDFRRNHPDEPGITAAVIAALAIADELFTEREARHSLEKEMNQACRDLADRLTAALSTGKSRPTTLPDPPTRTSGRSGKQRQKGTSSPRDTS